MKLAVVLQGIPPHSPLQSVKVNYCWFMNMSWSPGPSNQIPPLIDIYQKWTGALRSAAAATLKTNSIQTLSTVYNLLYLHQTPKLRWNVQLKSKYWKLWSLWGRMRGKKRKWMKWWASRRPEAEFTTKNGAQVRKITQKSNKVSAFFPAASSSRPRDRFTQK